MPAGFKEVVDAALDAALSARRADVLAVDERLAAAVDPNRSGNDRHPGPSRPLVSAS